MKKRIIGIIAALAVLMLLAGCGADARHEIYRVYQGRNGDWTLEVRLWVVYQGSPLLPADLQSDDNGTHTRTYWKLEYHGEKSAEELGIVRIEVGDTGLDESWEHSLQRGDSPWLDFRRDHYWLDDNSYTNGIDVGDSEACYATLTDTDGGTVSIEAPLTKSKG